MNEHQNADSVPNPGSGEAVTLGCTCAVFDNNHGRWAPYPPNGWWITEGCPLHNAPAQNDGSGSPEDQQ